jgi:hypothetical protein
MRLGKVTPANWRGENKCDRDTGKNLIQQLRYLPRATKIHQPGSATFASDAWRDAKVAALSSHSEARNECPFFGTFGT